VSNKIFLKIGLLFFISVLSYISFVIFFISPKVSNYLIDTEIRNTKSHFDKLVSVINNKSNDFQDKEYLLEELEEILMTFTLGDLGHVYLLSNTGKVIFDPSGEFKNQEEFEKQQAEEDEKKAEEALKDEILKFKYVYYEIDLLYICIYEIVILNTRSIYDLI
jgi:hypothetical protein